MIPDEVRKNAWSVRPDSHLGEYIGSEWNDVCETTFHFYRDKDDESLYWYDTDENRMLERHLKEWERMGRPVKRPRPANLESLLVNEIYHAHSIERQQDRGGSDSLPGKEKRE